MTNTKRITAVVALTFALSITAFAGDSTPACSPPLDGIMQSPPCASVQFASDESPTQPDVQTSLTDNSVISLTKATIDVLQSLLTIL